MSNADILKIAIQKALDNGWNYFGHYNFLTVDWWIDNEAYGAIIFNKDFAKALWPPIPNYELLCGNCTAQYNWWDKKETKKLGFPPSKFCNLCGHKLVKVVKDYTSPWHYHLRTMVVADDPIKYLGDNI